ncbi:hypothetical protein ACFQL8_14940, partial [Streptomyces goshikiensis]|uniref:hypothetical protein n=1 Tax=Streptomyces goshikiensis TaxID=1942 RepID=UPI00361989FF
NSNYPATAALTSRCRTTTDKNPQIITGRRRRSVSLFELATDRVMVVKRNERGPRGVDRDV